MANPISSPSPSTPPLYLRVSRKNISARAVELAILSLLLSLLLYRLLTINEHGVPWFIAFLCESWFTLMWAIIVNVKWNPIHNETYPQRLRKDELELPRVDMFVTTADAILEPPIITVNTVLSLLAVDYPADKLACYVSDDGGSPLTYYSLKEASKFAKVWVPFCKRYNVQERAPFRYFSGESATSVDASLEFQQDWKLMKDEYEKLGQKIHDASERSIPLELTGDFADFSNIESKNHPTIIKVIWENKEALANGVPHLTYISREKRPKHPHHYKAGAMNILTRVSGVMTNAPFILNVDCDMHINNPQVVHHAMCLLLGTKNEKDSGFVQFPQIFYDGLEDDPFGNQFVVLFEYIGHGIAGIQGPLYGGTGCFHRRKVIYGCLPDDKDINGRLSNQALTKTFGDSSELTKSTAEILSGKLDTVPRLDSSSSVEAACQVAGCCYEYGSLWGKEVGWIYESTVEDILTGLTIHNRGWRSAYCTPDPPAFLGCVPTGGPGSMIQQKRWTTGLLEILFTDKNPFTGSLKGKLQFRQCLTYLWIMSWGIGSIVDICYAILPAYCIITNSSFLPKTGEPAFIIPLSLLVGYNIYTLYEYIQTGLSVRAWWNNQRMWRLYSINARFFGILSIALKLLGLSETVFEVTQKEVSSDGEEINVNAGRFSFDNSPIFIPGTTVLFMNLAALAVGLLGFRPLPAQGGDGAGVGEFICSVCVVLIFWSFLKGLFGKGKYGIPWSTIYKSGVLVLLFVHLSRWASVNSYLNLVVKK